MDNSNNKKEILLIPDQPLSNRIEISVMDFPNGVPERADVDAIKSASRKRCKITVEYGRPDVMELKNQGMSLDAALEYYRNHIYELVRFRILSDWISVGALEEIMATIKDRLLPYYQS